MTLSIYVRIALVLGGVCASAVSMAQTFVKPEPIFQEGRFAPGFGNEAIVTAHYTVNTEGKTEDIELAGEFSNPFVESALKETVADWVFKPGSYNGQPSSYHNQEWVFVMRVNPNMPPMPGPGGRRGAPPKVEGCATGDNCISENIAAAGPVPLALSADVKEGFETISTLISAQDFDGALKEIKKVERKGLHTVFDFSLVNDLKATAYMGKKQYFEALEATKLATISAPNVQGDIQYFLTDDILKNTLLKQFVLATTNRQFGLAYDTYQILVDKFDLPADEKIHEQATIIKTALDSPDPLPALAKITDKSWSFKPSRRIFTVTDVVGSLKRIDAHCERSNLELEYMPDVDWTLPDAFGSCTLEFEGRDDTTFTIYEFKE